MLNISEVKESLKVRIGREQTQNYVLWDSLLPNGEFLALLYRQTKDRTEAVSSSVGNSGHAGECGTLGKNQHCFL